MTADEQSAQTVRAFAHHLTEFYVVLVRKCAQTRRPLRGTEWRGRSW